MESSNDHGPYIQINPGPDTSLHLYVSGATAWVYQEVPVRLEGTLECGTHVRMILSGKNQIFSIFEVAPKEITLEVNLIPLISP